MGRNLGRVTLILFMLVAMTANAEYESPPAYMTYLNNQEMELAKDYMDYVSAVNHGRSARKLEKRRAELMKTVNLARANTIHMKAYQGDTALRDAFAAYYTILISVLNEDYGKIVDLEEIAEQSYDNMEAYLMAQEKAGEKLNEAAKERSVAYKEFAKKNNIKLIASDSKVTRKLEQSGNVNRYYNQVYLIFFKSNKQEYYLVDAFNNGNVSAIEQSRTTLIRYAKEGLQKLAQIKSFEDDYSVVAACRKMLEFYQNEGDKKVPQITAFYMKKDEFEKTKKSYEAKSASERTNADIDAYNKMVNDINKASDAYNQVNKELNTNRNSLSDQWLTAVRKFLDSHTPR